MRRFFHWGMHHGAAILFGLALLIFFSGLISPLYDFFSMTTDMAGRHDYFPNDISLSVRLQAYAQILISALSNAAIAFLGAVLIDRLDRHWGKADGEGGE